MDYLYLAPLFVILYMIAVDRNLGEYLYLKLWSEPILWVQSSMLKYRLLLSLRYDRFLMGRGIIPRRFYDMAKELRDPSDDPK